jgi:hypothetical protein
LRYLDGRPETYQEWAAEYYEREVPLAAVQSIYSGQLLDKRLVSDLNDSVTMSDLTADIDEIGYPRFDG